jgi:ABC-type lipoprotein release transport system permease subunit
MWARADVRGRWKSLLALGILVGITAGFAMAAYAGARRTDTSFERLRERTNAPDAIVFASQSQQFRVDPSVWDELAKQPEVEKVAPWVLALGAVENDDEGVIMGSYDGRWIGDIDRGLLVAGRRFDPNAPDEAVLEEYAAQQEGIRVGDTIAYKPFLAKQFETEGEDPGPPAGPQLHIKVVGLVRTIEPHLFAALVMMSPGVIKHHPDVFYATNAMVQLKRDSADIAALRSHVNRLVGPGTPILDLHQVQRRVDTTLDVESAALRLLALAIALAGGLLVGQAISRSASTMQSDAGTLRSMGMVRTTMASAVVRSHVVVIVTAVLSAFFTALLISRWFPIGLANDIEPDHGFHADWVVLGIGLFATALFVTALVASAAFRSVRVARAQKPRRASKLIDGIQRRSPVSVGVGTAMVMERGRARLNIPVRQAMVGAIVGVVGVAATITINASLRDTVAHPERAGVAWDGFVTASDQTPDALDAPTIEKIRARRDIGASTVIHRYLLPVNGVGVQTFTLTDPVTKAGAPIAFTLLDGHEPRTADEVVLGPATAHDAKTNVGDTVTVGRHNVRATVVGHALFPQDVHASFDEGMWFTSEGLKRAGIPLNANGQEATDEFALAIRFVPDVDPATAFAALGKDFEQLGGVPAETPPELSNLRRVRSLPIVLAVFLAVLAFAALLHVLTTVARTRRADFAVLRALGMTRRATRGVFNVQGTAVAVIGLLVGIPVGVVLGRVVWRLIAQSVPLEDVPDNAVLGLVVIVVATLVIVNLLALWPGRRAARLHPAQVLRSE